MKLTVLTVPECPHAPVLDERLAEVLAGRPGIAVIRRVITGAREAAEAGMSGSPTLLIDGVDPFADPATPTSLSCRMYRDSDGGLAGAPSLDALRDALARPGTAQGRSPSPGPLGPPRVAEAPVLAAEPWADPLGRAGAGRLAPKIAGQRAVQQCVLGAFAATGRAPTAGDLAAAAAPHDPGTALAALHAADFLRLDSAGRLSAAYPFSAVPTPHAVRITGGASTFAMCAIDALGIAAMLRAGVGISSADPHTGEQIAISVTAPAGPAEPVEALWSPATAVVFAGRMADQATCQDPGCPSPAANVCCGYVNFFATPGNARAWATQHPEIIGRVLDQTRAEELGTAIFGSLLTQASDADR